MIINNNKEDINKVFIHVLVVSYLIKMLLEVYTNKRKRMYITLFANIYVK